MGRWKTLSTVLLLSAFFVTATFSSRVLRADSHLVEQSTTEDESPEGFEDDEDGMEGFGDEGDESVGLGEIKIDMAAIRTEGEVSPYTFGGFIREEIGYSHAHDDPDFSKIRTTLNLSLDAKFFDDWKGKFVWNGFYDYAYSRQGREKFTDETLDAYESESEIRDFYLDGPLTDWLRVKAGRQIIAWGESDTAQITDMANPRDLREIGMVDIEDARIPVAATKLSALLDSWEFNFVVIHEFRTNKIGTEGSEFDLLGGLRKSGATIEDEDLPEKNKQTETLFRVFKSFNGGDFSLVWADTFNDSFYLDRKSSGALVPKYKRVKTLGASGNFVSGSWLFKAELAKKFGKALALSQAEVQGLKSGERIWSEKDVLEGMIGADYSGISDLTITIEATGEKILAYDDALNDREIGGGFSLRLAHAALNDTLKSTLFWVHYTDNNGDVIRADVSYDLIDALQVSGGVINYLASEPDAVVYPFRDNDRIFASIKYSY